MQSTTMAMQELLSSIKVLVVDDEAYMRKVIRTLLLSIGVKTIYEAPDAPKGLDIIRTSSPDLVLLDWEMPGMNGGDFMRIVRSPGTFPFPSIPIIMLTGKAERSLVVEAVQLGVHEYLLKPVSSQALLARVMSVLVKPRPMVRIGDYFGPKPRKMSSYKPEVDAGYSKFVMLD
jgi:two-component system, chemotaxis family, chemotaxis protein CheY